MSQLPIRSIDGFARLTGVAPGNTTFVVTLKSVNHRYLDLQLFCRTAWTRLKFCGGKLKEHVVRGNTEVRLYAAARECRSRTAIQSRRGEGLH